VKAYSVGGLGALGGEVDHEEARLVGGGDGVVGEDLLEGGEHLVLLDLAPFGRDAGGQVLLDHGQPLELLAAVLLHALTRESDVQRVLSTHTHTHTVVSTPEE
jgi:hypothetical protein